VGRSAEAELTKMQSPMLMRLQEPVGCKAFPPAIAALRCGSAPLEVLLQGSLSKFSFDELRRASVRLNIDAP
jgi:hypothetical protein